jgi:hypothetical protein
MAEPLLGKIGELLSKQPWYKLPTLLAIPVLIELRNRLREHNLFDTEEPPMPKRDPATPIPEAARNSRLIDGTWNDMTCPAMGAAGRRFGRNFPLEQTVPDIANLLTPNPREVSRRLLTRTTFQPATILNLLAAAWIQFMVHDWFMHAKSSEESIDIPVSPDDSWPDKPMRVPRTLADPAPAGSTRPPAYANLSTHWWDASQIYGSDPVTARKLRTGVDGCLRIGDDGRLLIDPETGFELTGFTDNIWMGLSMLHALFVSEHNAICGMLKNRYPFFTDEQLYEKAKLVNSALLAKIHTVEWTPAILPNPITKLAMHANWYGVAGPEFRELAAFLKDDEVLSGIPGSTTDHHSAPYSLTEEFVSVYRMHPLLPDEYDIRSCRDHTLLGHHELPEIAGLKGRKILEKYSLADLFYSFGVTNPGAVRLHNHPRFLQHLVRDDGTQLDLGSIDILRDRERGVPRYNQFRRLIGKEPVASFEELTDNSKWREEIRALYKNDLEKVDLMVGLLAEPLPEGFGFSETAFRVFVLMASRRLKSDRFFTRDWDPEVYTPEGLAWVQENGMGSVLKRHLPEVAPAFEGVWNPFAPWNAAAAVRAGQAGA